MLSIKKLWEYQTADMELTRFEEELKKSKLRMELIAVRNKVMDQQNRYKKLEQDLVNGLTQCEKIADEYKRAYAEAERITNRFDTLETDDLNIVRNLYKELDEVNKKLNLLRKDLTVLNELADGSSKKIKEIREKLTKGKEEFDNLKQQHDQELSALAPELKKRKEVVTKLESGVDKALLERYKKIKRNRLNPVAVVENDQCSGCNMKLPSLVLRRLKENESIVECESCGRILYLKDN